MKIDVLPWLAAMCLVVSVGVKAESSDHAKHHRGQADSDHFQVGGFHRLTRSEHRADHRRLRQHKHAIQSDYRHARRYWNDPRFRYDDRRYRDRHWAHFSHRPYFNQGRYPRHYRDRYYSRHHDWRYGRHYDRHYRDSYWSGALAGALISHSFYHRHGTAICYERHDDDYWRSRPSDEAEVVGCHRIERGRDGLERRIEVPLSECR